MNKFSCLLTCPHLVEGQVVYCGISGDGIYIPLSSHLSEFCYSASQYKTCSYFLKAVELIQQVEQVGTGPHGATRRSFQRFKQRLPLYIDNRLARPSPQNIEANLAFTVDLSLGGAQVSSTKMLEADEDVSFVFDGAFSKPFWVGSAKVKWCQKDRRKNRFLAGLAFTDTDHKQILAHHIHEFAS